jgi:hypothetical protein
VANTREDKMEYEVVAEESLDDLLSIVRDFIAEGWKPTGGICVVVGKEFTYFYQAMIRLSEI